MNRARAKDGIDKAADDDIAKMFDVLRVNELGEDRSVAIGQFTEGMQKLNQQITDAKAVIDQIFPE